MRARLVNEGCNCGKKRPTPTVPNKTVIVKRPPPVVRRPLPKKLHEKFIEKSDPVKDMGIGVNPKVEAEKFMEEMYGNINRIAEKYFNNHKMEGPAYLIHKFFKLVLNGKAPQTAFFLAAEDENFYGDGAWVVEIRKKAADSIYKHHYIKINPNDPRLSGF
jgi:hypothetical protein